MRIAVVRNLSARGVVNAFGEPSREGCAEATVQAVAGALREDGHSVLVCEGDAAMLPALGAFMPPDTARAVGGMVFNLARGIQGEAARAHVPAMLELAGVPYTGPTPLGHALTYDTLAWRSLLSRAGVPTPRCATMRWPGDELTGLRYPLLVTPRDARGDVPGHVVHGRRQLGDAVELVLAVGGREAFVEEYLDGPAISAALIGNGDELELMPLVEQGEDADGEPPAARVLTSDPLAMRVGARAAAAFRACHCQDYGRVVLRLDQAGRPLVVGLDSMPRLEPDSIFVRAAVAGDYGHATLVERILDVAHRRYFGVSAPRYEDSGAATQPEAALLSPGSPP